MDNLQNNEGLLIVNVSYAEKVYPIEGALVTVLQKKENSLEIISASTTDESGRSAPTVIVTPDISLSLSPGQDAIPYAKVTIDVEKEGFYRAQFVDAPIFPGVVSVQNVNLIPKDRFSGNDFYNDTVFKESEAPNL